MSDLHLLDCFKPGSVKLERVRYFQRQLLTADDMVADQEYFRQKLRRHNRFLHGWGVVCGLAVIADPTSDLAWRARVETGYCLGPYGDEIFVAKSLHIDLAQCGPGALTDPCEPNVLQTRGTGVAGELFLAIKYAECKGRPVRSMALGCGCDDQACEYSRICDSFQIECLTELPPSHLGEPPELSLCDYVNGQGLPPCPPCPADPWVVLAKVTLPASPSTKLAENNIDNFVRRQIFSTAILQQQLIECCCEEREPPPPTPPVVTSITIANEPTIQVNSPSIPPVIIQRDPGTPSLRNIQITFDKSLKGETVNNKTVQVERKPEGTGQESPWKTVDDNQVTYTDQPPTALVSGPLSFGQYKLTVYGKTPGEEESPILDEVNKLALDGNRDGDPGENFVFYFQIISTIS